MRSTFFISSAMILCGSLFSVAAHSQATAIQENSREIQVKYLDGDNDALLFNLKYDNYSGDNFKLMVVNETGDILFQSNYSGKNFKKHVKLPRLTDSDDVTFLIRPAKSNIQFSRKVKVTNKVNDSAIEND